MKEQKFYFSAVIVNGYFDISYEWAGVAKDENEAYNMVCEGLESEWDYIEFFDGHYE